MREIVNPKTIHPVVQRIQQNFHSINEDSKKITLCKIPSHTGIPGNERADRAAKEATHLPGHHTSFIPHKDFYPTFRFYRNRKWQARWNNVEPNNKLKMIRPNIGKWTLPSGCSRQFQVKLSRLRMGHTNLTHSHLMEGTLQKYCSFCYTPSTSVHHLLIDCPACLQKQE